MTNAEYLQWLNDTLRADADYMAGMSFVAYPVDVTIERATGYDWPRDAGHDATYIRAASRVREQYLAAHAPPGTGAVQDPVSGRWLSYRIETERRGDGLACKVFLRDGTGHGIPPYNLPIAGLSLSKRAELDLVARAVRVAPYANRD
jgi:hypothetical protein